MVQRHDDPRGEPNWQPVTAVAMMAGMLTEQLAANREQLELLERARREPWLLDDATVDRVKKVFGVQRDDMWLWEENGRRWQALDLDTATRAQVDGYMSLAARFATANTEVLALADEIAGGTISKVMAKSDLELGIEALHRCCFGWVGHAHVGSAPCTRNTPADEPGAPAQVAAVHAAVAGVRAWRGDCGAPPVPQQRRVLRCGRLIAGRGRRRAR